MLPPPAGGGGGGKLDAVIACYEKDVSEMARAMAARHGARVLEYYKCRPDKPHNVPVNKGNEASAYLKYIVDHYDALPKRVFFCHDEDLSWHHRGSIVDRLGEAIDSDQGFYNVNSYRLGKITTNPWHAKILAWWDSLCAPHVPHMDRYPADWTYGHKGCAQFLVSGERILQYPKRFYEDLYRWITTTDLDSAESGRYLEWTWHVMWDTPPGGADRPRRPRNALP